MRIVLDLQACQSWDTRNRGIGRYSMALAQAIARQGGAHEIWLALNGRFSESVPEIRGAFQDLIPQERIAVFQVSPGDGNSDPAHEWRSRAAELMREQFIASLKPDVVHLSSLYEGFYDGVTSTVSPDVATSATLYDLIPLIRADTYLTEHRRRAWYFRKLQHLKKADLLLAISEHSRREAIDALNIPEHAVVNISSAVDHSRFSPQRVSPEQEQTLRRRYGLPRPFVMYTGGFDPRKNLKGLIEAYALLPASLRSARQLAIVGAVQQHEREQLMQVAADAGLPPDDIVLTDFVPDDDLIALYRLCDLFVLPSLHEGFGLPALEAMACGAPVIGANTTSIPEVIGRQDAMFDPSRPAAIAETMARVLADAGQRDGLREHGLQQAKRFSWDDTARRAISAFESLRESSRPKTPNSALNPKPARKSRSLDVRLGTTSIETLYEPAESHAELSMGLITNLMHSFWLERPDLQKVFPLTTRESVVRFLVWYWQQGGREADSGLASEPAKMFSRLSGGLVTTGMIFVWLQRGDLQQEFSLADRVSVGRFLMWVWQHGRSECEFLVDVFSMHEPARGYSKISENLISNAMLLVWLQSQDLQECYPLTSRADVARFLLWVWRFGREEYELLRDVPRGAAALSGAAVAMAKSLVGFGKAKAVGQQSLSTEGVNLLGYVTGVFGLGEHGRRVARSFLASGVAVNAVDLTDPADKRGIDTSLVDFIGWDSKNAVSLIEVHPNEMIPAIALHGDALFRGRYNIGHWSWELPHWPRQWLMPLQAVDEIWATSSFVARAFAEMVDKPIHVMPLSIDVPDIDWGRHDRNHFGLPRDSFIFFFAFDAFSFFERKNSMGCIAAFQQAFPGRTDVGLVIKVLAARSDDPQWSQVLAAAERDSRIRIVTASLHRNEMWGLMNACDCFLSLHRSEGFGLGIMEAMALGKPVVATAYSGNMDFMNEQNSCPVRHTLRPVQPGQYVVWEGQVWAEPDCEHAAGFMRRLVDEDGYGKMLGASARRHILENYNSRVLGARYASRLATIKTALRSGTMPPRGP